MLKILLTLSFSLTFAQTTPTAIFTFFYFIGTTGAIYLPRFCTRLLSTNISLDEISMPNDPYLLLAKPRLLFTHFFVFLLYELAYCLFMTFIYSNILSTLIKNQYG